MKNTKVEKEETKTKGILLYFFLFSSVCKEKEEVRSR
jgi:hypothetical protein